MITRGLFIGKIIDDLALLQFQIEARNSLSQFDLTKICEDFFKEVLNITYSYNLINLNKTRNNNPGLDLGDKKNKIAFQITSQKTSQKINDTLNAIIPEHKKLFKDIMVFIIGEKQKTYKLDDKLCKEYKFDAYKIIDIKSLTKEISTLDIDQLDTLYRLFQREFNHVRIELEPMDSEGNFNSSLYNILEKKPSSPPINGSKFIKDIDNDEKKNLIELYGKLANIPRVTRELIPIIVERGKFDESINFRGKFHINLEILRRFLRLSEQEFTSEMNILEEIDLISIDCISVGESERNVPHILIYNEMLTQLIIWLSENEINLRVFFNTMDFTLLDE